MKNTRAFKQVDFGPSDEVVTVPIPGAGPLGKVAVYSRLTGSAGAASLRVFGSFVSVPETNEVQTIDLGDIAAADTFKLTFNGNETAAAITYSTDMTVTITSGLVSTTDFDAGDISVAKVSLTVYTVTFQGQYANRDVGAITITTVVGFTPIGVTETVKGGSASADLTDTTALTDALVLVVDAQENVYPYLTLAYNGDDDPDLTAEAYVVSY